MSASRSEITDDIGSGEPGSGAPAPGAGSGPAGAAESAPHGADLLAALLDGMDAALCAFDAQGTVTHWNREAERVLGWTAAEAVGRRGLAGWAVREADADEVQGRLMASMDSPGREVHEFALLRKDGGRVLVRTQSARVTGADGEPAGVYCAFTEVHAQIDLERSIALSEALFDDAAWGVVLVDVDLRPAVVNAEALRVLGAGRSGVLGRPLGEVVVQGVEELEGALHHVLAEGPPRGLADLWVTVAGPDGERRRCWRSGFLRLASPLAEQPVPLGVGWLFHDVTDARLAEQEADRLRFRAGQLHRAGRAVAECADALEAARVCADFALAGFADHALVDLVEDEGRRLVRAAVSPGRAPGPSPGTAGGGLPVRYAKGHPAHQSLDRLGPVRASAPDPDAADDWARRRQWPAGSIHALCTVLRARGRTVGLLTLLRTTSRPAFTPQDAVYAESLAAVAAGALAMPGA
ncbi:PAS domain-containing protein [Streptomyces sp. NPDC005805]|uniref:PAS domain-containing protein n=1 Tax=Streptomyces sp. NPDC005805 TaxID=3157068 RepID=UPI0033F30F93